MLLKKKSDRARSMRSVMIKQVVHKTPGELEKIKVIKLKLKLKF